MLSRLTVGALVVALGLGSVAAKPNPKPDRESRIANRESGVVPTMVDFDEQYAIDQERLAVAAYLAAVEAETVRLYLEAMRPKIAVDWARWQRLHICEQSDTWYANGGNRADPYHQTFQGGLGMSTVAWQMAVRAAAARGVTLPASALAASPEEQMTGAQAFVDAYGWAWACRV